MKFRLIILTVYMFFTINIYSQNTINIIQEIDSLKRDIKKNENNRSIYYTINVDGVFLKKKKIRLPFLKSRIVGGYAETYLLKDSVLVNLFHGERKYLNKDGSLSTNKVENYIFKKGELCYYKEDFYTEKEDKDDIKLYSLEIYIENNRIIKQNIVGDFEKEINLYLKKVKSKSANSLTYIREFVKYQK